jgi:hypothetical protein
MKSSLSWNLHLALPTMGCLCLLLLQYLHSTSLAIRFSSNLRIENKLAPCFNPCQNQSETADYLNYKLLGSCKPVLKAGAEGYA